MERQLKILLAEDDRNLGTLLETFLKAKGFEVDLARDGKQALEKFNEGTYQFLILDVMMPELDGFSVAKEIREVDSHIPILFLTAKSMKEDKLEGFAAGADDYLTKPFSMEELLARVEAILRRSHVTNLPLDDNFSIGTFNFDAQTRILTRDGQEQKLTTKEGQLLKLLAKNKNNILNRDAALRAIWGDDNYFNGRSMDVYIAKLRKMLKDDENIQIINIHGTGFKLIDQE